MREVLRGAGTGLALVVVMLVAFAASSLAKDAKKVAHKSPVPANTANEQDCKLPGDATAKQQTSAAPVADADPVSAKERIPATNSMKLKSSSEDVEGEASAQECAKQEGRSAADAECQGEKSKAGALQCERTPAHPPDLVLSSSPKDGPHE
jgi:hypothetical protein